MHRRDLACLHDCLSLVDQMLHGLLIRRQLVGLQQFMENRRMIQGLVTVLALQLCSHLPCEILVGRVSCDRSGAVPGFRVGLPFGS